MARRKHVKRQPDIFQRAFTGAFEQISGAGMLIAACLVGLLLVMALLWGISSWRQKREDQAWKKFAAALREGKPAGQDKRLEEVLKETAGTRAHPMVLLALAARSHQKAIALPARTMGERAKLLGCARRTIEEFLADYPDHRMAVRARANLAKALEDSGQVEKALAAFRQAAEAAADTEFSFMEGELLWGRARCAQKLGRSEKALELLERALDKDRSGRRSGWAIAAAHMRDTLRRPEPAKNLLVKGAARDKPPEEKKAPEKPGEPEKRPTPAPAGTRDKR